MGNLADRWIAHRNMNAAITAIGLSLLLIWALFQDSGSLVSQENISAVVVEIKSYSSERNTAYLLLELPDKKIIKIFANVKPFPKIGDTMPVILELYDNDKKLYSINHKKWLDDQYF